MSATVTCCIGFEVYLIGKLKNGTDAVVGLHVYTFMTPYVCEEKEFPAEAL